MIASTYLDTSSSEEIKACCANLYESDWAKLLLGDSFHPGGLALTERLGELLGLRSGQRVLDVASGQGVSALFLAEQFGCEVVGVDYGRSAITQANQTAQKAGLSHLVTFQQGDAEQLPFEAASFDAVICECAFCTFPGKATAVAEFNRVLKPGGKIGLSDLTRTGSVPAELTNLLGWIACIADAQPTEEYVRFLADGRFHIQQIETHDHALLELVKQVRLKLIGADLLLKLKQIEIPTIHFEEAKTIARHAEKAIQSGQFGYGLIIGHS